MLSDSATKTERLKDNIIILVSDFMKDKTEISANSADNISSKVLSKRLIQNSSELEKLGIFFELRRSNGKRLIGLRRNSDDSDG